MITSFTATTTTATIFGTISGLFVIFDYHLPALFFGSCAVLLLLLALLLPRKNVSKKSPIKNQIKPHSQIITNVKLTKDPTKILQLFATNEELTIGYLMGMTFLDPVKIEYWLEDLESKKFIGHRAYYDDTASEYFLKQAGRKYLIENNLLQDGLL